MKDPLKQGLKHIAAQNYANDDNKSVEVKDPLKQGLKHCSCIPSRSAI